jgi:hypothetical protein
VEDLLCEPARVRARERVLDRSVESAAGHKPRNDALDDLVPHSRFDDLLGQPGRERAIDQTSELGNEHIVRGLGDLVARGASSYPCGVERKAPRRRGKTGLTLVVIGEGHGRYQNRS